MGSDVNVVGKVHIKVFYINKLSHIYNNSALTGLKKLHILPFMSQSSQF